METVVESSNIKLKSPYSSFISLTKLFSELIDLACCLKLVINSSGLSELSLPHEDNKTNIKKIDNNISYINYMKIVKLCNE